MPPGMGATSAEPRTIRVLPPLVVNQIAAGEVVERPASVVKELVDNAIDAGSTRIVVEIESGGIELVRVRDNGSGIAREQLGLAIHPHATSKIISTDDLDRIATMGFRGEALASIASVSRLEIASRQPGFDECWSLGVEGGTVGEPRPIAGPVGTAVTVRNLFFNTPARRKFLRTSATEQDHCVEIVRALAMAHPAIGFAMLADGRTLMDLPPGQPLRARVLAILGAEMEEQYLEAAADEFDDARGVTLWGLVGLPVLARPTAAKQRMFLNGRPIRDRTIQHALREAYRGLIEPGRHPAAVLMVEMDPRAVDVNVHPAKAEVRFRDSGMVHKAVYLAVREALRRADLTPDAGVARAGDTGSGAWKFESVERLPPATAAAAAVRERFVDYFKRFVPSEDGKGLDFAGLRDAVERERAEVEAERLRLAEQRAALVSGAEPQAASGMLEEKPGVPAIARPASRVMQVHNSYIVTQDEHGVVIIDQHALHERVMFQKLTERIAKGTLESQRMLVPAAADTTPARLELLGALAPLLVRLGIEAELLGPTTVGVHAFPTLLLERRVEPGQFLAEVLEKAEGERWDQATSAEALGEAALHEVLDMMACKAAVKAGESLSEADLAEMLALRGTVDRASNCPHGRPTALRLTLAELERQFGRR